ncbi:unnamed protein product [Acanthoscelides obtectus]|uniref:Angio-associated migratory cell protein n=1 Tax=Acanthoscelides obtectus TaxID=200917 RepID=A0A9P0JRZ1_ACAOB|nr:unnamed protein product [Acanthoscelides obtectus]CAK1637335.1 Angio-associated migratory cell protein [Acanthoscelides obtectus]
MDDQDIPEDELEDIEVIYSDGEDADYDEQQAENMIEDSNEVEIEAEVIDLSILTFSKHTKSVFCSDVNKSGQIAVTGGEDDIAYVWDTNSGDVLFECTGHKDSVTEACFNYDGQFVATGDMAGMIQVWSVEEKKLVWCFEGDDMEWLFWHPKANVLLCGCHSGDVYVWQMPQGHCKVLPSPDNAAATCAKLLPNGKQLLAGYEDGNLQLWNIKEVTSEWSNSQFHTVTNVDVNEEGLLAVVAPSSNIVKLADGKVTTTLLPNEETEIEAATFNRETGVVATGSLSGQLCVWEVGKQALRHQARIECSVTVLKWGPATKIFIGATDGAVYVCDVKTGSLLETLTGHKADVLSISLLDPDGKRILTTSDDATVKIFNVN